MLCTSEHMFCTTNHYHTRSTTDRQQYTDAVRQAGALCAGAFLRMEVTRARAHDGATHRYRRPKVVILQDKIQAGFPALIAMSAYHINSCFRGGCRVLSLLPICTERYCNRRYHRRTLVCILYHTNSTRTTFELSSLHTHIWTHE